MSSSKIPSRMKHDKRWLAGCFTITTISVYFVYKFASGTMPSLFPNLSLHSLKEIAPKYRINIGAAPPMLLTAWLIVFPSRALSLAVLYKLSSFFNTVNERFYINGVISMLATTLWLFSYSFENLWRSLFWVTWVALSNWVMLFQGCQRMERCKRKEHLTRFKPLPSRYEQLFKWAVVETCSFSAVWSTAAWMFTLTQLIAYEPSYHLPQAKLRDFITVEKAGTLSLICYALVMLAWMYMDFVDRPLQTLHASGVYPSSALIMLGLFLSNYSWTQGLLLNNGLCLTLSVASLAVLVFRQTLRKAFGNELNRDGEKRA